MKSIINRTFGLLPVAILLGSGVGIFYLGAIMIGYHYHMTGHLPDISGIPDNLSGLKQLTKIFGG